MTYCPIVFSKRGVAHRESCARAPWRDELRFNPDGWNDEDRPYRMDGGVTHTLAWVRPCERCRPDVDSEDA